MIPSINSGLSGAGQKKSAHLPVQRATKPESRVWTIRLNGALRGAHRRDYRKQSSTLMEIIQSVIFRLEVRGLDVLRPKKVENQVAFYHTVSKHTSPRKQKLWRLGKSREAVRSITRFRNPYDVQTISRGILLDIERDIKPSNTILAACRVEPFPDMQEKLNASGLNPLEDNTSNSLIISL